MALLALANCDEQTGKVDLFVVAKIDLFEVFGLPQEVRNSQQFVALIAFRGNRKVTQAADRNFDVASGDGSQFRFQAGFDFCGVFIVWVPLWLAVFVRAG